MDFLFWLRRFRVGKIPTNIKEEDLNKLLVKIKGFVKSKSFNFRNLVNLFFDLSHLNKYTDEIIFEIFNELKIDNKLLTPFTVVQLLQALCRKEIIVSSKGYNLVDFVAKQLPTILQEFDSDQKSQIFQYLSVLELDLHGPKFRIPQVLYPLRIQLKESLDQLSEMSVSHILDAYQSLPKEFPFDIVEEIKDMVLLTVQHNCANIKSFFLT